MIVVFFFLNGLSDLSLNKNIFILIAFKLLVDVSQRLTVSFSGLTAETLNYKRYVIQNFDLRIKRNMRITSL